MIYLDTITPHAPSIEGIPVVLMESSNYSKTNESVESKPPLYEKKVGEDGKNIKSAKTSLKSIDTGKGKRTFSWSYRTLHTKDTQALFQILDTSTKLSCVDSFVGRINIFLKSFSYSTSPIYPNEFVFKISGAVQEKQVDLRVDYRLKIEDVKKNITPAFEKTSEEMKNRSEFTYSTGSDGVPIRVVEEPVIKFTREPLAFDSFSFFDSHLDLIFKEMGKISSMRYPVLSFFNDMKERKQKITDIYSAIYNFPKSIKNFTDVILKYVETDIDVHNYILPKLKKYKSPYGLGTLSKYAQKKLYPILQTERLISSVLCLKYMHLLLKQDLVYKQVLYDIFYAFLKSLNNSLYSPRDKQLLKQDISSHIQTLKVFKLETVFIRDPIPLLVFVYERYGHLEYYSNIIALNDIPKHSEVQGFLKVIV